MKQLGVVAPLRRWMTTLLRDDVQSGRATGPVEGGAAAAILPRAGHEAHRSRARADGVASLDRMLPARSEFQRGAGGPGRSAL
jgi:hypothetical protein